MKLVVCEYENKESEFICNCIRKILYNDVEIYVFESGNEFLKSEIVADLIYMNIKKENFKNYKITKEIKEKNYKSEIIFTTDDVHHIINGYKIGIFRCNLKPIKYREIEENINDFIKKINDKKVFVKDNKNSYVISKEEIMYIEVTGKYSTVFTEKKSYKLKLSMKEIEKNLNSRNFFKCHRSFLINLKKVEELSEKDSVIKINNDINIPISRNKIKEFKSKILEIV